MEPFGLLMTGASFAVFRGLHWVLQHLPTPKAAARNRWKWRNICVSLVHSLLAGTGALLGLSFFPQMIADPIRGHPPGALMLVAVSVGYFLADAADLLRNQTLGQAWDLLCHHLVVISCLSTAILSGHYVGFSVVSLLLELNSACLHFRKLLLLSHQAPSLAFNMASWATLATLVLFRLVPLGWMSLWLAQQREVPPALVVLGGVGLLTIGVMSIVLGVRILIHDVLQYRPCPPTSGHKETPDTRAYCAGEHVTRDVSAFNMRN